MAKAIIATFIEIKDAKHYSKEQQANPNKINWRSKQNTYHVTNESIAPSEVTDNVGDERGDALRGIPKIRGLDITWISPCSALGIPKIELLCLLNSSHIMVSLFIKSFIHNKLNKNLWDRLV